MATRSRRATGDVNVPPVIYLVCGITLTIIGAAAYVYLREDADTRAGLMLWLLPLITTLFVAAKVDNSQRDTREHLAEQDEHLEKQNEALSTITAQTNGVLTERIRTAVSDALANRDAAIAAGNTQPAPVPSESADESVDA